MRADRYNAADDLIGRNLERRSEKLAVVDDRGSYTYSDVASRVDRFAGFLLSLDLPVESRVLLCMQDSANFYVACLGAIKVGLVPVMVNPLLTSADLAYMLWDSRARALVASWEAWPALSRAVGASSYLDHVVIADGDAPNGTTAFESALESAVPIAAPAPTREDEPCLWQYSSGTTGRPKGTIHSHGNVRRLMDLYPREVLGLTDQDVTFSAAKLYFGYGFGNGLVFPFSAGATAILMAGRPTAGEVWQRINRHRPTVFFGVPTLYASLLDAPDAPSISRLSMRICISAGEALPKPLGERWLERFGMDIVDGIGSTEMFHIYMSNRPGDVRYGTTGHPIAGYDVRLIDESGGAVSEGQIGELHVRGPTAALGYWCRRDQTRSTFVGEWTRTGDRFRLDSDGRYIYCGRSDDMLKVGGIYVSPVEVEGALLSHASVLEAAVVAALDDANLVKPKAYVVLHESATPSLEMERELKAHVKTLLAPFKYPRWIEFVDALPKTATGKIARYRLREGAS